MTRARRFPDSDLELLREVKILGVRAGPEHRHTGVWVVVVDGRILVRSWNDKPTGWYRAFRAEPSGSISVAGREIRVRAATMLYGTNYNTKASREWLQSGCEDSRSPRAR